jgi:hypothetical protein
MLMILSLLLCTGCGASLKVTTMDVPGGTEVFYDAEGPGSTRVVREAQALDTTESLAASTGRVDMTLTDDTLRVSAGRQGQQVGGYMPTAPLVLGPGGQPVPTGARSTLPNLAVYPSGVPPASGSEFEDLRKDVRANTKDIRANTDAILQLDD